MKKILGAILGLALIYVGISFSLGFVAEAALKEQLEHHNKHAGQMNGMTLEVKNFSRGILSSTMDITIHFTGTEIPLNLLSFSSHTKVQHGPLLLLNGFSIGAYATESTLVMTTADEETNKKIKSIFGDSIGLVRANYSFTKTYSGNWTLEPINLKEGGTQVTVDKTLFNFAGDFNNSQAPNIHGELSVGAILVKGDTGEVLMDGWEGKIDQRIIDSVPVANMTLATKKISIQSSMSLPISLENLSIEQKQQVTDKKLSTSIAMRLDKFSGPLDVKNSFYQIEFNNLPLDGLKQVYEVMNNPDVHASSEQQLAVLVPALTNILVDGIQFKLAVGSEFMEGKLVGDFNIGYHAPADGKTIMDMESPEQMLSLFSADLNMTVSESIVNRTPLAAQLQPLVGTYVTAEQGTYVLTAKLKDTAVTVGTQTIPAEQYLPLLMMGAMGMAAGQNREQPVDENGYATEMPEGEMTGEEIYEEVEAQDTVPEVIE